MDGHPRRIRVSVKPRLARSCMLSSVWQSSGQRRRWPRVMPFSYQQGHFGSLNDSETCPRILVLRVFSGSICPQPHPRIGREPLPYIHLSSQLLKCRLSRAWACLRSTVLPWLLDCHPSSCDLPGAKEGGPNLNWPKIGSGPLSLESTPSLSCPFMQLSALASQVTLTSRSHCTCAFGLEDTVVPDTHENHIQYLPPEPLAPCAARASCPRPRNQHPDSAFMSGLESGSGFF